MSVLYSLLRDQFREFFSYSTVRSATIKSTKVACVYRYELILNKGYQKTDFVSSTVTTKVKGLGFVPINKTKDAYNESDPSFYENQFVLDPSLAYKILDTADYVIPPNEYNSIFIMTNFLETFQTQGTCAEESHIAFCKNDQDCSDIGTSFNTWNGVPTSKCVNNSNLNVLSSCEISAWCPTENEDNRNDDTLIRNVLNYTIFIKNDIDFKKFKYKQRNILPNATNSYVSLCNHDSVKDKYCPVFKLNYIVSKIEADPKEKYNLLMKGGVLLIGNVFFTMNDSNYKQKKCDCKILSDIIWNCDLDFGRVCLPVYNFRRFDTKETKTALGFNFRFSDKFKMQNTNYRMQYKAYGLRIIINVSGKAGKFHIIPLLMTIGAGIGIMSLSAIIPDCVMLYFTKKKKRYSEVAHIEETKVIDYQKKSVVWSKSWWI